MKRQISVKEIIDFLDNDILYVFGQINNLFINSLNSSDSITNDSIDWINSNKTNKQEIAENSKARVILVDNEVKYSETLKKKNKVLLIVFDPKLSIAKIGNHYFIKKPKPGIHNSATIDPSARIGKDVYIGPGCFIGDCEIGDRTLIYPNVTIYNRSIIGNEVVIHSGAIICVDGLGCLRQVDGALFEFPQLGGVIIGNNVLIGANTHIACGSLSDTIIGDGSKVNGMSFIGSNCILGKNTWITGSTMLAGSVKVGDNVTIFSRVVVREYCKIGDWSVIGMGAVVTKDIPAQETWFGNPAKKFK